jgi:glyoxylase-like metal-dependent hydrolase (beta-lactamase superfamily II)
MERTRPFQVSLLPITVRVIVRDWLNANSIVLLQPGYNVVVDTGYSSHANQTLALVRQPEHLGDEPIQLVVNTHCHSDHMGGNALLARTYGCPVAVPEGEASLIREWDTRALWLDYADQRAERFAVDQELVVGRRYGWGGLSWEAIAAPGHDTGALVFYCEAEQLLISGDALWENGFGVVPPDRPGALAAARETLDRIAALDVAVVIPGHGRPFTGIAAALDRSYQRMEAFNADSVRMARHALKVMLMFTLLERRQLPLSTLSEYLDSIPVYREYNAAYLGLAPSALAEMLVTELERAGAITRSGEFLKPAVRNSW